MTVYRVQQRETSFEEFDNGQQYVRVFGEVRVWPSGEREPVIGFVGSKGEPLKDGGADFVIGDVPLVIAALSEQYLRLFRDEGLKVVRDGD